MQTVLAPLDKPLIVVPCSATKVWSKQPAAKELAACGAYCGAVWSQNRKYAELHGGAWVILSAKYGFINPLTPIRDYNQSFRNGTATVSEDLLRTQAVQLAAGNKHIVSLGSRHYNAAIRKAFAGLDVSIEYPLEGLGQMLARKWVIYQLPEPKGGRAFETYQQTEARKEQRAKRKALQPTFF